MKFLWSSKYFEFDIIILVALIVEKKVMITALLGIQNLNLIFRSVLITMSTELYAKRNELNAKYQSVLFRSVIW